MSASPTIRINGRDIDLSLGTVRRGDAPPDVLRPQALAVLKLFLANPGALVSKDELMASVWPGIAVTDDSLVKCVTEIRKVLGDDAHTIVKTVPKRGYVFEPAGQAARQRKLKELHVAASLAAFVALALLTAYFARPEAVRAQSYRPGVAVLPFNNLSGEARWGELADGLTEDTITHLSRFAHLKVIARQPVGTPSGEAMDMREAGRALGAHYVIHGGVRRNGEALRISAQLIDTATGGVVWAQRWDRAEAAGTVLQDEVAASIAVATGDVFGSGAIVRADAAKARSRPAAARSAYDHMVIGISLDGGRSKQAVADSLVSINRALALDPEMGLAYAARGWLHEFSIDFGTGRQVAIAAMGADMRKAIELDPHNAITLASYSYYLSLAGQLSDAAAMARHAIAMNPLDSFVLCIASTVLAYAGHLDEALVLADRLRAIDPHARPVLATCSTGAYFLGRRFETVTEVAGNVLPEWRPSHVRFEYAASLAFLGRVRDAELARAAFLQSRPGATAQMYYTEGWHFAREAERNLFFDGFRALKLPMCATPEQLKQIAMPAPLPECPAGAGR